MTTHLQQNEKTYKKQKMNFREQNMTNERLLALFDHYGIDSRDALIEHLHEQLTHMRIVHPIKDPQIDADRQAKERYEHLFRTTTSEERERDFHENGFC